MQDWVAACPWGEVWERRLADGWAVAVVATREAVDIRIDGDVLWRHDLLLHLPSVADWTDAWSTMRFVEDGSAPETPCC